MSGFCKIVTSIVAGHKTNNRKTVKINTALEENTMAYFD